MTPAEHGQERWTITKFGFRENVVGPEVQGVEVVPADRERALVEAIAEHAAYVRRVYGSRAVADAKGQQVWDSVDALDRIQELR